MKLIKAIIRPNKVDDLKEAFAKIQIAGMTVTEVRGHGRQKGHTAVYRGREYEVTLLPKMQVETVVPDELVEPALQAIREAARTGEIGDGRVFICPVEQAYNIRTGKGIRVTSENENEDLISDFVFSSIRYDFPHAPHAHNATDHCCFWLRWTTVRAVSVRPRRSRERHSLKLSPFDAWRSAERTLSSVTALSLRFFFLLIAQREVERSPDLAVVDRHGAIRVRAERRPGAATTGRPPRKAPSRRRRKTTPPTIHRPVRSVLACIRGGDHTTPGAERAGNDCAREGGYRQATSVL